MSRAVEQYRVLLALVKACEVLIDFKNGSDGNKNGMVYTLGESKMSDRLRDSAIWVKMVDCMRSSK